MLNASEESRRVVLLMDWKKRRVNLWRHLPWSMLPLPLNCLSQYDYDELGIGYQCVYDRIENCLDPNFVDLSPNEHHL